MLSSIIVYTFIICALYFLPKIKTKYVEGSIISYKNKDYTKLITISFLVFIFFSGVRYDVGVDHLQYLEFYEDTLKYGFIDRNDIESGWLYLMGIFTSFGANSSLFFGFLAFMQLYFSFKFYKHEKYLFPYFGAILMMSGSYFSWMNGIRQEIVATAFLFAINLFIIEKKFFKYLFFIYILSFIHTSAWLLLPLYLITFLPLDKIYINKYIQYILFGGAIILSSTSVWENLLTYIDTLTVLIGYDERYNSDVLMKVGERTLAFGPRRVIFLIIDIVLISYSEKMRKIYHSKTYGITLIFFIVFYILQPIFMNNLALSRIVGYFYIFRTIMTSYFLFYVWQVKRNNKNIICGTIIFLLYCMHLFIQIYADAGKHTDCIRYQFIWNN